MLVYFRDFCNENNLTFYLAWGSLLGAIRHKGFIPWDDDIDVQMPRKDYERLLEIWNSKADVTKYKCERTDENRCVKYPMSVLRRVDTTCIYEHSKDLDICHGLKIDVEFLDAVPNQKWKRNRNRELAKILALLRAERVPIRQPFYIKTISKIILTILPSHKLRWKVSKFIENIIVNSASDEECEFYRYLSCALEPKSCFDPLYVDFEGYKMPIPKGYDRLLKSAYGNYMKLPPEEQRKPGTDNLVFYDLDHSYVDYKGRYYCIKGC